MRYCAEVPCTAKVAAILTKKGIAIFLSATIHVGKPCCDYKEITPVKVQRKTQTRETIETQETIESSFLWGVVGKHFQMVGPGSVGTLAARICFVKASR